MSKPDTKQSDAAPVVEVVGRVDAFAQEAGLLPEFVPASGKRVIHNPRHWVYRAICLRMTWNEHTLVTQQQFSAAVEAVSEITL